MINIIIALLMGLQVQATALPVPTMFPPDLQIWDTIYNVFGVTRPYIADAERLQAYYDLYEKVLGASYDQFREDMQEVIEASKTSGQLVLSPDLVTQLEQGMNEALTTGFSNNDGTESFVGFAQWRAFLQSIGLTGLSDSELNWLHNANAIDLLGVVYLGEDYVLIFSSETALGSVCYVDSFNTSTYALFRSAGNTWGGRYRIYPIRDNTITGASVHSSIGGILWPKSYGIPRTPILSSGTPNTYTKSFPWVLEVAERMANAVLRVLTPNTRLTIDGTFDLTQPTVIRIPSIWVTPSATVDGIPTIQDETQTRPYIDDSIPITDQIAALRTQAETDYGDAEKYRIDLTEFFPFCIPWDLQLLMQSFQAEPEAPVIDWLFSVGYEDGEIKMETFTLDLSIWDTVAQYLRLGELALYIVGLAVATRHIYIRG